MVMDMITTQRYELILNFLNENGNGTINDFGKLTGTSSATILQHLTQLEDDALLSRNHDMKTIERVERDNNNKDNGVKTLIKKNVIANTEVAFKENNDSIFIDY